MHHEQSGRGGRAFIELQKPAILSVICGPGGTNAVTGVIGA